KQTGRVHRGEARLAHETRSSSRALRQVIALAAACRRRSASAALLGEGLLPPPAAKPKVSRASTTRKDAQQPRPSGSTKHRIEPHVLAHLGPLLLVVHEKLTIAEMLAFFLPLGGDEHAPHRDAREVALSAVALPDARRRLLAERFDDLIVE